MRSTLRQSARRPTAPTGVAATSSVSEVPLLSGTSPETTEWRRLEILSRRSEVVTPAALAMAVFRHSIYHLIFTVMPEMTFSNFSLHSLRLFP